MQNLLVFFWSDDLLFNFCSVQPNDKESLSFVFRASVSSESKQGWVKSQLLQIFGPNDNKLALKLFGSKKALMRPKVGFKQMEVHLVQLRLVNLNLKNPPVLQVRQKREQNWVIHPMSQFRWTFF